MRPKFAEVWKLVTVSNWILEFSPISNSDYFKTKNKLNKEKKKQVERQKRMRSFERHSVGDWEKWNAPKSVDVHVRERTPWAIKA